MIEEDGRAAVGWHGNVLARLAPGRSLLEPALRTSRALDQLSAARRAELRARLESWLDAQVDQNLRAAEEAGDRCNRPRELGGRPRGCRHARRRRRSAAPPHPGRRPSPRSSRPTARPCTGSASASARSTSSIRRLLKPAAQQWRAILQSVRSNRPVPALPARRRSDDRSDADAARRRARLSPPRPAMAAHRPRRPPRQPCPQGPFGGRRRAGRRRAGDLRRP